MGEDIILKSKFREEKKFETLKENTETQILNKPLLRQSKTNHIEKTLISGSKFKMITQLLLTRLRQEKEIKNLTTKHFDINSNDARNDGVKQGLLTNWRI